MVASHGVGPDLASMGDDSDRVGDSGRLGDKIADEDKGVNALLIV
jgi:hypothetical protein